MAPPSAESATLANDTSQSGNDLVNSIQSNGDSNGTNGRENLNEHSTHQSPFSSSTDGPQLNGQNGVNGHNGVSHGVPEPIAICGMACRLPGGLASAQELWDFVLAKKDARCRVPASRYNVSSYYSTTLKPGTVSTEYGNFLDESVDLGALDTSFFTLPRTEVERADPQQRLMLEVARECFEDAGVTNWRGKTIGCYIGNFGEDWVELFSHETQQWGMHRIVGTGDFVISNRLSYEFDIKGPSMTIRTGCSAALVALNEACAAIGRGDCEAALVGGVNLILAPSMTTAMTEQGILSTDGSCKSFSAEANGYARGEAVTAIYVKPLADAIRDGNPVRAVIRSTSHNVDGKTPGLSQPSTDAQEALMRRAYQLAGISDFSQTAMIECHGTGTPTGDPIEAKAVARVFGEKGIIIGSVKPNMGHTEAASGLVSLIKMVKALENRTIPPNIRFKTPNPNIPFKEAKLTVPLDPQPWPEGRLERISLNSFGVGGANAHAILESAKTFNAGPLYRETPEIPQLVLFTANTPKSLTKLVNNYKAWIEKNPDKVTDLAYTLARRREHLPHRAFAIVRDGVIESVSQPTNTKTMQKLNVVMVFTGQGAQWPQMGRELLQSNDIFKSSIHALDQRLQSATGSPYSIVEELQKPAKKSRLSSAEIAQPLCTAIQIALVDTLRAMGITPTAVVGHSSGEIAAGYASGAITFEEAIIAAHHRGAVTSKQERSGSMAAIGMGWSETEPYLVPNVNIACDNSSSSVTISGDSEAVQAVIADIQQEQPDKMTRLLQVNKAYHSYHMAEIGEDYLSLIGDVVVGKDPSALFFSSVTGGLLDRPLDATYWKDNLESPVRFREAITAIINHEVGKNALFLEIGPHAALSGPLRQIFTETSSPSPYVAAMLRGKNSVSSLLTAVGKLHCLGKSLDLERLFPDDKGTCLADLPTYPWNHEESYWYEPRVVREWRSRKFPYHDLLGLKLPESTDLEPSWRNMFHITNVPWIRDHRVGEDCIFPFAGYIALAGKAVEQISGIQAGFSVRNVRVSIALVLSEGKPTEMITTFRPLRLTHSLNSSWWEFTVASYNGHVWTKHCTGEVSALSSHLAAAEGSHPTELPRKVDVKKWYENLSKGGLDLGPSFQTLSTIETSTNSDNAAIGSVTNGRQGDEENYHVHPTVLDATIQIMGAAAVNGHTRKTKNWLPTSIDQFDVYRCGLDMVCNASAKLSSNYSVVGGGSCSADGVKVLSAKGIKMSLADGAISNQDGDTHAAARYEWGPHLDFLDIQKLLHVSADQSDKLRLLDDLGDLCMLLSKRRLGNSENLGNSETRPPHLQKYEGWLRSQISDVCSRLSSVLTTIDNDSISAKIEEIVAQLSGTPAASAARAIHQVCRSSSELISGYSFDSVIEEDLQSELLKFVYNLDISSFLKHLSHSNPNLRILEIGDNGLSSAAEVLKNLTRPEGQILCSKYTVTSSGFVSNKDQTLLFPNMEYVTLDINEDPDGQGFEGRPLYDLIIAKNTLHKTKSLHGSLRNLKKLLRPDGRLIVQDLNPSAKWLNYVFGLQAAWWAGAADGRGQEPYVTADRWHTELASLGYGEVEATVFDADRQQPLTATLVVRGSPPSKFLDKKITILCPDVVQEEGRRLSLLIGQLEQQGYRVTKCTLSDCPPPGQDIISLLDLDQPFFTGLDEARFQAFKVFVLSLNDCTGLFWVTQCSQIGCEDPRFGSIFGLSRVLRSEMIADFATCEVESLDSITDPTTTAYIIQLLERFQHRHGNDSAEERTLTPDYEWAIRDNQVYVGRFHPFSLRHELLESGYGDKAILDVETPGRINSLHWVRQPREALKPGEVEVQVHSAGLNFRDILVALGVVELPIRQFGLEAAGIITRVGEGVDPEQLAVGDRVFCLKKQAYSTYITTPTVFCTRIPDDLGFDEAASMLMPYVTAIHGLVNVAHLSKGQSVLVHSACGGVGLAAVQIAQMIGSDLYVTVGNDEKVEFLMDTFNIPRNRIFNSRDKSFVDGVMRETGGLGIDVILNSLSGELLHATWGCVAEFGTLVEIGKRDLIGGGKLDMEPFLANRSYCCIDIDQLWKKPVLLRKLILSTLEYVVKGYTTPVRPVKVFPAEQTQDAFRFMQKGQHIGRVGISIQHRADEADVAFKTTQRARPIEFDSSASYLLIGGLGGLGRSISTWMVEHGARELLFLSRGAKSPSSTNEAFVAELRSLGCEAKLVAGDVSNIEDVSRVIRSADHPLKGVVQMAMVIRDQSFPNMTFDEWSAATSPKVQGTWNLHEATVAAGCDLDFMVLFSSLSGIIGQPGQANYASANTFLDAFTQYRNGKGLPASVIDIGAVEDIGYISQNHGLINKMKTTGFKGITEQELLDGITVAMLSKAKASPLQARATEDGGYAHLVHGNTFVLGLGSSIPVNSPANRAVWRTDRRMAAYHNTHATAGGEAASNETLKSFMASVKADPSVLKTPEASGLLALEIGKKLFDLLLKSQDDLVTSLPLVDLGLDSLVALELRAWWKQIFSLDISVLEMLGMGSLDALGQHAADELLRVATESKEDDVA